MYQNLPQFNPAKSGKNTVSTFVRSDDPQPHLEKSGEFDRYAYIQSFTDQTDYTKILEQMEKGNPVAEVKAVSMISEPKELQYGVQNRKTLKEVGNDIFTAKKVFDELGGENKLGLSFNEFLAAGQIVAGDISEAQPAAPATPEEGAAQ